LAQVNLKRNDFHGEWNYTISPRTKQADILTRVLCFDMAGTSPM
jgi:hypothetical protein